MPLSGRDYGRIAAENLGEPVWRSGLVQPVVPDFDEMRERVQGIFTYHGYPVLDLVWLPNHKVIRKGIQQVAYAIWMEDVNNHKMELVPLPRYGVLQRVPPDAEVAEGWTLRQEWEREANEWFADHGQAYLHELPPEGIWKGVPGYEVLAKHHVIRDGPFLGHTCCYRKLAEEQTTCYGEIFLPTWRLVEAVERGWREYMSKPVRRHGTEAAPAEEKAAVTLAGNRANAAGKNKVWDKIGEDFKQEMTSVKYKDPKLFSMTSLVPGVAAAAAAIATKPKKTAKEL